MGKATLDMVTRHRFLYPVVYLGVGAWYVAVWVVGRAGLAARWNSRV